jgi:tRNA pseudouridine55 synthase
MDGVINFLKPPGMTSNTAVVLIRKHFGVKKVGHAGTLDPGACGVLPICVGKATRISAYMMDAQKEYVAEVTFGKRTDTGDSYGSVIKPHL